MFYVYILKTSGRGQLYIGYSSDLKARIKQHQSKQSRSTKYKPMQKLVYYEAYTSKSDALAREGQLKKFKSAYGHLRKRIEKSIDTRS